MTSLTDSLIHYPVNNVLIKAASLVNQMFFQVDDIKDMTVVDDFIVAIQPEILLHCILFQFQVL